MQRIFFHNKHDKRSRDILAGLTGDVLVYDVYGGAKIPPWARRLREYPYLIDRYFDFTPAASYPIGTITLTITCRDYLDNAITDDSDKIIVTLDGARYVVRPENGIIAIEVSCLEERSLELKLEGGHYLPLETVVVVSA